MGRSQLRLGVVSAGTILLGLSTAGTGQAEEAPCTGADGALTMTADMLCKTTTSVTGGATRAVDGATGGMTSGATGALGSTVDVANSRLQALAHSADRTTPGPSSRKPARKKKSNPPKDRQRTHATPAAGSFAGLFRAQPNLPLFGESRTGGAEPSVQLPKVAATPSASNTSLAAPPDPLDGGALWMVVIAAAAAGLVGGGHIGLLLRPRRQEPDT